MRRALLFLLAAGAWGQIRVMECGVVYNGSLSAERTQETFTFQSEEENDAIAIRVLPASSDTAFSVSVGITDPSGIVLDPRPVNHDTRGYEFDLNVTGTYTIVVKAGKTSQVGTFRIVRTRLKGPCASNTLTCGVTVSGAIDSPLAVRSYRFTGEAGDLFSLRLAKTTVNPTSNDTAAKFRVLVFDPSGQLALIGTNTYAGWESTSAMRGDMRLPVRGTYTLLLMEVSTGGRTGTYSLTITRLNGGCRTKAVSCGSAVDSAIAEATAVDAYALTAAAGEAYMLRRVRTDGNLRLILEVYDPKGNLVTAAASSDATRYGFTAETAGTYTAIVSDDPRYGLTSTGKYSFSVARLSNPCNAQALECGSVANSSVDGPLRLVTYSVSAQAGDIHLLRLLRTQTSNGFKPRLEIFDPKGNQVQVTGTVDLTRTTFTAAISGTYTLVATDGLDGTRTGGFAVSLARLNRPCGAVPLGCAGSARGSIEAPLRFGTYSYAAGAGDSFTVRMLGTGGNFQESLEVYDPAGNAVGTVVPGNARGIDVARPAAGTYTILAMDGSKTPGSGSYLVQAFRTRNGCVSAAPQGVTLAGVITGPAPFSAHTLAASEGDSLLLRSASFSSGFNAAMDLYDPEGVRMTSGTYALTARAAAAGNYTLVMSASDPRTTGRHAFSWQALNRPANVTPLACGQTLSSTLSASSQFRYYAAGGAAGDLLRLVLTRVSEGFTPTLELYDTAGQRLAGASTDLSRRASVDGDHLVLVSPSTASGETGAFALSFQRPNNPCGALPLACGQTVLRKVGLAGQLDTFRFDAGANQRFTLRLPTRLGTFAPYVELYDGSGALLQSGAATQLTRTPAADSAYTMLVRDRVGGSTGTYRVSLQHEPDACPVDDKEAPVIALDRPTGGEVAAGGTAFRIVWQSDDNVDVASHQVLLSTDACQTFPTVLAGTLGGATQSFDWQVPATIAPTRQGCIRVVATDAAGNTSAADSGPLALIGSGFEANSTVTYEYDGLNRVSRALYGDGTVVWYQYDGAGNLVRTIVTKQEAVP